MPMLMEVEAQQPQQRSPASSTTTTRRVVFATLLLVGAFVGTALFLLAPTGSPAAQATARDHEEVEQEHGPADILLRQIRRLGAQDLEQELALRTSLGHIYRDQGRYTQAVKHYSLAHDTAVKLGGADRIVTVLQARGAARFQQGRLATARKDLEMAYVLADKEHAPEQAIDVLHALGDVQRDQGKLSDALELYEKATKMAKDQLSGDVLGPKVASLTTDIGELHARKGQNAQALPFLRQALKQLEELGRDPMRHSAVADPQLALTQSLLGSALQTSGDTAHAMESYRKALRQQMRSLGPVHPDLIFTRLSIARAHRDMGENAKALETVEAVEKTVRDGPQEGPDLARTLTVKADLLREAKRYPEATESIAEALRHQGSCFGGEPNPEIAVALTGYGSILHDQGKFKDALRNYQRALELNMQTVGPEHPETAATHNNIGTLHQDAGDDLEAQKHFEMSLDVQLKNNGPVSLDMATTYNNLATILYRRRELEDAARLLAKALEVLDEVGAPEGSPDRAIYRENLDEVVQLIHKKSVVPQDDGVKGFGAAGAGAPVM